MPGDNFQDRTEKATPKRRQEARRKGQVAQSREIPSAAILLASLAVFLFGGADMFDRMARFMGAVFQNLNAYRFDDIASTHLFLTQTFGVIGGILMPLLIVVFAIGIMANVVQFGFLITGEAMTPKFSKLNPLSGLKRLVSLKSWVELAKSLLKILFVGTIAYLLVRGELKTLPGMMDWAVADTMRFLGRVSLKICFFVCLGLTLLGVVDYFYQRWEHEKSLKMTKQEVKDEHKQTEGDPKIKAKIRRLQLEMAQRRMMQAVPEADVVITNPTHLAVALKFDPEVMVAPCVVAKGAGHIAHQIKEIAAANDVPLVENKPLAQTLFKAVELGAAIPAELYKAVAEILAYVYRMKGMYSH